MNSVNELGLAIDFYHLTMAQGYFHSKKKNMHVCFEMFIRSNPFQSGYTVFVGLQNFLDDLTCFCFTDTMIESLRKMEIFSEEFLLYLREFKFRGSIYSPKEGDIIFPHEPIIIVEGYLIEVQMIESLLLNYINFQSFIATKASRIFYASAGKPFIELGLRRAYSLQGGFFATRASLIAGASGTSNMLVLGNMPQVKVVGTMSHSWVLSYESEYQAFVDFGIHYPNSCVFLIDTYTVKQGIHNAVKAFDFLKKENIINDNSYKAIRIDSGDLSAMAFEVRSILDDADLTDVQIIVSNDLDESIIADLVRVNAPIDSFGVGTQLITGGDFDNLKGVYKMSGYKSDNDNWIPTMKISNNIFKISLPGRKSIIRFWDSDNSIIGDLICLKEETQTILEKIAKKEAIVFYSISGITSVNLNNYAYATLFLHEVMRNGEIVEPKLSVLEIQSYFHKCFEALGDAYKRFMNPHLYEVGLSLQLTQLRNYLIKEKM